MKLGYNDYSTPSVGGNSGIASGLSGFGSPSTMSSKNSPNVPQVALPTTAGDYNQLTGISGDFLKQSDTAMADPSQMDLWNDRSGFGKTFWNQDGSFDMGAAGSVLQGLGGLGSLYLGFQANKTAQDSLKFKERSYEENMANQISSFNMALEDKARSRAVQSNQSSEQAQSYIDKHKL